MGISVSKDFCSSSSTSVRVSSTGSMSSPRRTVSRFRVVVGLSSDALCQIRFPTLDWFSLNSAQHLSHCGLLQTSLPVQGEIGSVILETHWNKVVISIFIKQFLEMNSHLLTNFAVSRNQVTSVVFYIEVLLFFTRDPRNS